MLDLSKIQSIAQSYSPQELFAALVWQRQFNRFNGEQVITDLCGRTDLWAMTLKYLHFPLQQRRLTHHQHLCSVYWRGFHFWK